MSELQYATAFQQVVPAFMQLVLTTAGLHPESGPLKIAPLSTSTQLRQARPLSEACAQAFTEKVFTYWPGHCRSWVTMPAILRSFCKSICIHIPSVGESGIHALPESSIEVP